jgi:hypothetical protein
MYYPTWIGFSSRIKPLAALFIGGSSYTEKREREVAA